jgi:hypothetical protein
MSDAPPTSGPPFMNERRSPDILCCMVSLEGIHEILQKNCQHGKQSDLLHGGVRIAECLGRICVLFTTRLTTGLR